MPSKIKKRHLTRFLTYLIDATPIGVGDSRYFDAVLREDGVFEVSIIDPNKGHATTDRFRVTVERIKG